MPITLGVLGARNAITKQILNCEILNPIFDDLDGKIKKILLPEEPLSSTYIEAWAMSREIEVETLKSDWITNGKRAGVLRDVQIEKQSTALLIFEGPRSQYYMTLAERIAKRRPTARVYLVNANSVSPILLDVEFNVTEKEEKDILTLPKMFSAKKCLIED